MFWEMTEFAIIPKVDIWLLGELQKTEKDNMSYYNKTQYQ